MVDACVAPLCGGALVFAGAAVAPPGAAIKPGCCSRGAAGCCTAAGGGIATGSFGTSASPSFAGKRNFDRVWPDTGRPGADRADSLPSEHGASAVHAAHRPTIAIARRPPGNKNARPISQRPGCGMEISLFDWSVRVHRDDSPRCVAFDATTFVVLFFLPCRRTHLGQTQRPGMVPISSLRRPNPPRSACGIRHDLSRCKNRTGRTGSNDYASRVRPRRL